MLALRTLALCAAVALAAGACSRKQDMHQVASAIGDIHRGSELIVGAGCGACHAISGRDRMTGRVGPPLDAMGRRTIVAGVLPNNPANMVRWLRFPQSVVPGNAMPNTNLSEKDARDIAAYLYTLR